MTAAKAIAIAKRTPFSSNVTPLYVVRRFLPHELYRTAFSRFVNGSKCATKTWHRSANHPLVIT